MAYWLMKSEPNVYGIADLQREQTTLWDGIRNYQARNFMRQMQSGDLAFFYHSNSNPPGIVGLMEVVETCLVDPTQFDPESPYFDPGATTTSPRWDCARLRYVTTFARLLSLDELRRLSSRGFGRGAQGQPPLDPARQRSRIPSPARAVG